MIFYRERFEKTIVFGKCNHTAVCLAVPFKWVSVSPNLTGFVFALDVTLSIFVEDRTEFVSSVDY